jgi:Family of unknown function (DUF6491)
MACKTPIAWGRAMPAKFLFLLAWLTVGVTPVWANTSMRCFSLSDMSGWSSPDGKTVYIRTGVDRYYRIDLARRCSSLKSITPQLVLTNRQGGVICSALGLDVKATETPGGVLEPCFPKAISQLSAAEAAALPKNAKP